MKILQATKIVDPAAVPTLEKELKVASLDEVKAKLASIQPYMAALGLGDRPVPTQTTGMVPFQAGVATDKPADIFTASVDNIDFSKVKTSDIMEMYQ